MVCSGPIRSAYSGYFEDAMSFTETEAQQKSHGRATNSAADARKLLKRVGVVQTKLREAMRWDQA